MKDKESKETKVAGQQDDDLEEVKKKIKKKALETSVLRKLIGEVDPSKKEQ
jgi:hypothetical protein